MNTLHQELLSQIKGHSRPLDPKFNAARYNGNNHHFFNVTVPDKRKIAKEFARRHPELSNSELMTLLDGLFDGVSYEEKTVAGLLLAYFPKHKQELPLEKLDRWLNHLIGWAEIDTLCQSNFTAPEVLRRFENWEKLINKFSIDPNISKRRASLVLLVKPVSGSDDSLLEKFAFKMIDRLKTEPEILITKAISWLMRALITHHKEEVKVYLNENSETLPKIALREVRNKLTTGKK